MVKQVLFYVKNMSIPLSMAVVERAIRRTRTPSAEAISIAGIQEAIAERCRVPLTALLGKSRRSDLVARRQMAMYLCKLYTPASLRAIGAAFGGRNHATVLHSCRVFEQRYQADAFLQREVDRLVSALGMTPLALDGVA